jgi:uncharacterized OsmC-like protein
MSRRLHCSKNLPLKGTGGGGTAMSAPQLFVAALGACILEFVLNSCRLRGVPAKQVSVEMTMRSRAWVDRTGNLRHL